MKIEKFIEMTMQNCNGHTPFAKEAFHRQSTSVLKELAKALGYEKKDYDLRHNKGGIAVSGEIILHSDTLYVCFCQYGIEEGSSCFLWRTCQGRKDYTGGPNQWLPWTALRDLPAVARSMNLRAGRNPITGSAVNVLMSTY